MTTIIPSTLPTGPRRIVPAAIFAAAVAAMFMTAPTANAVSDGDIKFFCDAQGGNFYTIEYNGHHYTECCQKGRGCQIYKDGAYQGTVGGSENEEPPPPDTGIPPTLKGPVPSQILVPGNPPPANNPG